MTSDKYVSIRINSSKALFAVLVLLIVVLIFLFVNQKKEMHSLRAKSIEQNNQIRLLENAIDDLESKNSDLEDGFQDLENRVYDLESIRNF